MTHGGGIPFNRDRDVLLSASGVQWQACLGMQPATAVQKYNSQRKPIVYLLMIANNGVPHQ